MPATQIRFHEFWCYINLYVCMYVCPLHLSDVATFPWEIQKSYFQHYYSYILLITYVISEKINCNPLAHPTWKCHQSNLWIANFHLTKVSLHSFKCWKLRIDPVVGCRRWFWQEPVVMCGYWNVRQAVSQQVFRVTTFCVNTWHASSLYWHWSVA